MNENNIVTGGPYKGQRFVETELFNHFYDFQGWRKVLLIDENSHQAYRDVRVEFLGKIQ